MDRKTYRRIRERDLAGRRVCLVVPLSTGLASWPAGTLAEIERKYAGFTLRSEPCRCCGVRLRATRVSPRCIMLLDEAGGSLAANLSHGECDGCHREAQLVVYRDELDGSVDQELCQRCGSWPQDWRELPRAS